MKLRVAPWLAVPGVLYLSLLFVYGLGVALADGWHEQIVKRGWTVELLPDADHISAMQSAQVLPVLRPWLVAALA